MKKIRFIFKYLHYYLTSKTRHDIHSPFVFDLLTNVILAENNFHAFQKIENIRSAVLNSKKEISVTDYGARGSLNSAPTKGNVKTIKDIAKRSAKSSKYGRLLFRLVSRFKPKILLELGTSLGISSLYQALPDKNARLITIEGCGETAKIAKDNFNTADLHNIELITGNFDETLPEVLKSTTKLDYVFFDGNHRKYPTIDYFEQCLPQAHNDSLFILPPAAP